MQDLKEQHLNLDEDGDDADALVEEYTELELNEEEAPFLRGQTKKAGLVEPVKISRDPDGSLQQRAMKQAQLSKDRKDIREMQKT